MNDHYSALLDDLLSQLGKDTGIEELAFDIQGQARLVFDDRIAVNFERDAANAVMHVFSTLDDAQALLADADRDSLLRINFLTQKTAGAAFGIDPQLGDVVLSWQWHPEGGSYPHFRDRLSRFVSVIEQVPQLLESETERTELSPVLLADTGHRPQL